MKLPLLLLLVTWLQFNLTAQQMTLDQTARIEKFEALQDWYGVVLVLEEVAQMTLHRYGRQSLAYANSLRPIPQKILLTGRCHRATATFLRYRKLAMELSQIDEVTLERETEAFRRALNDCPGNQLPALETLTYYAPPASTDQPLKLPPLPPPPAIDDQFTAYIASGEKDKAVEFAYQIYIENKVAGDSAAMINILALMGSAMLINPKHPLNKRFLWEGIEWLQQQAQNDLGLAQALKVFEYAKLSIPMASDTRRPEVLSAFIPYPNLLDSVVDYPDKSFTFFVSEAARFIHVAAGGNLSPCEAEYEEGLNQKNVQHEDALVSFVNRYKHRSTSLPSLLLDFTLAQEYLINGRTRRELYAATLAEEDITFGALLARRDSLRDARISAYLSGAITIQDSATAAVEREFCDRLTGVIPDEKIPTTVDLQNWIKPDEALVKIYRYHPRQKDQWVSIAEYVAIVFRGDGSLPSFVPLPGQDSLEYEFYYNYQEEVFITPTGNAYADYWAPIAKVLGDAGTVYYVPDGIYTRINPSLLQNPDTGLPLLTEFDLVQLDFITSLGKPTLRSTEIKRALLVGNPDFGGNAAPATTGFRVADLDRRGKWNPLPGTKLEIDHADKVLGERQISSVKLFDTLATKTHVTKTIDRYNPDLLHIATHAYFRPFQDVLGFGLPQPPPLTDDYDMLLLSLRDGKGRYGIKDSIDFTEYFAQFDDDDNDLPDLLKPEGQADQRQRVATKSGLVLTGANLSDSAMINTFELRSLSIRNTKLIILSACDIGKEDMVSLLSNLGFRGAFREQGVRYLISSIWPVHDRSAIAFIGRFYEEWIVKGLSIEKSFNRAQRERHESKDPAFHWGGFMLTKL